jgi:hypothetical protein
VSNLQAAGISVVVVLAVAAFFWIRGSESQLGGHAGDEIANRIERECGDSTREKVEPADFRTPAFSRQATEVIFVTCPSGEVNPYAELNQFGSAVELERAFKNSGLKVNRDWYCVAGDVAISGSLSDFAALCRDLGGAFRCPAACQRRVRTQRIPAVPVEGDPSSG